ncbi:sulfotransferase [Christiangramia sediminicola]|uniref:Sulfotransferase n=1 Tax=Christiangramia sediminicola TaxID=3073267 RepID=A0ABU1EM52_9FLAO|nr:sulfotransferase [Christiangramia sp. SM2212]MDR5589333.1 sulfotransferase [Christiangramia sp. SM2212]
MNNSNHLKKPIIFIGTGRSGTTIFSEIIMRHPDLAYISNYQVKFPKYPVVNLIRIIFENKLWNFKGQKKQLNKISLFNRFAFNPVEGFNIWNNLVGGDKVFSRGFLIDHEISETQIIHTRKYFKNLVRFQGKKRLALKITGPSRISYLLKIFPDAVFINLTRNDIPVISSFLKIPFWQKRGLNKLWWTGAYTQKELNYANSLFHDPILITAFQVKKIKIVTELEINELNPVCKNVSYESFVANPSNILADTLNFLDLTENAKVCFNYLSKLRIEDRNKIDTDYFSEQTLEAINNINLKIENGIA